MALDDGWIVTIVLGSVLLVVIILVVVWYYKLRHRGLSKPENALDPKDRAPLVDKDVEPVPKASDRWEQTLEEFSRRKTAMAYNSVDDVPSDPMNDGIMSSDQMNDSMTSSEQVHGDTGSENSVPEEAYEAYARSWGSEQYRKGLDA